MINLMIDTDMDMDELEKISVVLVQQEEAGTQEFECPICYDTKTASEGMMSSCHHLYCSECIAEHIQSCHADSRTASCPLCRSPHFVLETTDLTRFTELNKVLTEYDAWKVDDQIYMAFLYFHFPDYRA